MKDAIEPSHFCHFGDVAVVCANQFERSAIDFNSAGSSLSLRAATTLFVMSS